MGAEFEVGSLEEMCRLMCDNYIPRRRPHKCGECKHLSSEKCSIGYRCVNPEKKLKWKSPTAMWKYKHTPACRMFELKEERDQMTNKEAIEELKKVDTLDMPARLCEAHYMSIKALEQEPKTGHCKDCKYFEYDSVAKVDGVPLIVAHEMCSRWGDGCKTKEDGYCFLFEPQESEEV